MYLVPFQKSIMEFFDGKSSILNVCLGPEHKKFGKLRSKTKWNQGNEVENTNEENTLFAHKTYQTLP